MGNLNKAHTATPLYPSPIGEGTGEVPDKMRIQYRHASKHE
jgi:hypothetical protein